MARAGNLPVFLKEINIQGFKSFADRIKLELGQGLSVIVGPNGSGKSNIADAVRWVLGEQSAKSLRGAKMEDVIFGGSNKRRPVGLAEVSLIFDNTTGIFPLDFREVTITRRIYRDGEGQYLINRTPCRLRDIQELFMDTGAGKEGFSIIGQGRIEEILTLKAEERRGLIEEASGISKYRVRKREAVKRLDDTVANLQRLEDILQEINGQLGPLAGQAAIAETFLKLNCEKKNLEIALIAGDLIEIRQKLVTVVGDAESLSQMETSLRSDLTREENETVEVKYALNRMDEQITGQQQLVYQAEQDANGLRHEIGLRRERLRFLQLEKDRLGREIQLETQKEQSAREQVAALEGKQAVLRETLATVHQAVRQQSAALDDLRAQTNQEEFEQLKGDLFAKLSEQANCSNEVTSLQHTLAGDERQLEQVRRERAQKEAELAAAREAAAELEQQGRESAQGIRKLLAAIAAAEADQSRYDRERRETQGQLGELTRRIDTMQARRQALQNLEDSLEGYQRGVRETMLAKRRGVPACRGLTGTVAELLRVDQRFEAAIETAAGSALQNVVALTMDAATAAVAYLKEHKLGQATFLPLDTIRASRVAVTREVSGEPGFVGVAVDLVEFDAQYRPALEYVLGRILIVTDMDAAVRVARKTGFKQRIVTLDGDQIMTGGAVTGGSMQRKGGMLARSREIAELQATLQDLVIQNGGLEGTCRQLEQAAQETGASLAVHRQEHQDRRERLARLKAKEEELQKGLPALKRAVQVLTLQEQELKAGQAGITGHLGQATERLAQIERDVQALHLALSRQEQVAKETAGEIEKLSADLTGQKVQLAKWEQEAVSTADALVRKRVELRETIQAREQKENSLAGLAGSEQTVALEITTLDEQLVALDQDQVSLQRDLAGLRQEKEQLAGSLVALEESVREKRQQLQTVQQRLHNCQLKAARWEAEWESGQTRLQEEFGLGWEAAMTCLDGRPREAVWQRLQEVRREIGDLGPVNQAAVEDYPKMVQRQEFLASQHQDMVAANQSLRNLIAELDKTMCDRFAAGFAAVNSAFQVVFTDLFQGGMAELRLVDPDDLLETGVEIIAQPPGKRPQLLSLLSGGERALTAIALLFALLKVKPSPFCILDEIEASLDDANVLRFAQYLKGLAHSTQFICISHRKGTMEAADVLYGISMEESGVSKLLTVELEEQAG